MGVYNYGKHKNESISDIEVDYCLIETLCTFNEEHPLAVFYIFNSVAIIFIIITLVLITKMLCLDNLPEVSSNVRANLDNSFDSYNSQHNMSAEEDLPEVSSDVRANLDHSLEYNERQHDMSAGEDLPEVSAHVQSNLDYSLESYENLYDMSARDNNYTFQDEEETISNIIVQD